MTLPLEGTRVLDLGTQTPGKFCTFLLGDLGAEVMRIERPVSQATPESSLTVWRTPGSDFALESSTEMIFAPRIGACTIAAFSIPGS